jgi:poly-gamma-glutamate synthesis protein (capsule biosynthesis protein)
MKQMDLMWVNNEFVYSDRGEALEGKAWTFKGATENVKYLHELGVDIVGLANNHVFDYGEDAFVDTLDTLQSAGIPYVGAGHDLAEASSPVYLDTDGIRVAYVAASCAEYTIYTREAQVGEPGIMWCYDDEKFLAEIRTAAENSDFVVALPHWGTEHSTELTDKQTSSAKAYIDAGADVVIGAHAHNLQGIEYYNGKPILYNLGNFWFDEYELDTVLAEIKISGNRTPGMPVDMSKANVDVLLHPGRQVNVHTYPVNDPVERRRIFSDLERISINISIGDDGSVHSTV